MKKIISLLLAAILIVCLCGCGQKIAFLSDRQIQYDSDSEKHTLFWSFEDKNEKHLKASAEFSIKIVNDEKEVVYEQVKKVTENDFGMWSSLLQGDMLLGSIEIDRKDIKKGLSSTGNIYFTVKGDSFSFDESKLSIEDLPVKESDLRLADGQSLPFEVHDYNWDDKIDNTVRITDVKYVFETGWISNSFKITLTGERISGNQESAYCEFSYRVYDDAGYVVESGNIFTDSLRIGEKFNNETIYISDAKPGITYTLELGDCKW